MYGHAMYGHIATPISNAGARPDQAEPFTGSVHRRGGGQETLPATTVRPR